MISATSPNQQGVAGTDSEDVWMITEESAILVISTSLLGTLLFFLIKEAYFQARSLLLTSRCAIRGPYGLDCPHSRASARPTRQVKRCCYCPRSPPDENDGAAPAAHPGPPAPPPGRVLPTCDARTAHTAA